MVREDKINYYINIARNVALRSTCVRRKFGAIIVKNDSIIATGYNGSARGAYNCGTDIPCLKNLYNEAHETSYDTCSSEHAEANAIAQAGWERCNEATMFLAPHEGKGFLPCFQCRRKILNANVDGVYYINEDESLKYVLREELLEMEKTWQKNTLLAKDPDWDLRLL